MKENPKIGECARHPGHSMIDCPVCSMEEGLSEDVLKSIDEHIGKNFVTARFGDKWKEYAEAFLEKKQLIDIAWKQGRRAILLEKLVKELLKK